MPTRGQTNIDKRPREWTARPAISSDNEKITLAKPRKQEKGQERGKLMQTEIEQTTKGYQARQPARIKC